MSRLNKIKNNKKKLTTKQLREMYYLSVVECRSKEYIAERLGICISSVYKYLHQHEMEQARNKRTVAESLEELRF